jgi:copper transporter 1
MLFTWDTTDLCIIFRQWHISSTFSLIASLLGVVILTAGYELVREISRRYEASSAEYMNNLPSKLPLAATQYGATLLAKRVMRSR